MRAEKQRILKQLKNNKLIDVDELGWIENQQLTKAERKLVDAKWSDINKEYN